MFCKYCGKELPNGAKFCAQCGKQLIKETSENIEIKNYPKNENIFTPQFQEQRATNTFSYIPPSENNQKYIPTESSKSRLLAALLAFFLGTLGAHRFYVGKTGSAIFQLILGLSFFIAMLSLVFDGLELAVVFVLIGIVWVFWVLIDFIIILCGSFKDKDGLPLTNWDF